MKKIYCRGYDKEIPNDRCYYAAGSQACKSCPYRPQEIPKIQYKVSTKKSTPKKSHTESINLDRITHTYKYIHEVHFTFWEDEKFIQWQLMRLNDEYQKDLNDVFGVWDEYLIATDKKDEMEPNLRMFEEDCPPEPGDTFEEWRKQYQGEMDSHIYLKFQIDQRHQILQVYKDKKSLKQYTDDYIGFRDRAGKRILWSPFDYNLMNPPPISYDIRFPYPDLLDQLPSWRDETKKKPGRPKDWKLDLFVYEMSLYEGIKDSDIARSVFNKELSTQIYNRISDIKKRIGKAVTQSYPLPPYPPMEFTH